MKSDVWQFYKKTCKIDEKADNVACNLCDKVLIQRDGSTTNMRSHLAAAHPKEYANRGPGSSSASKSTSSKVQVSEKTKSKLALFASPDADADDSRHSSGSKPADAVLLVSSDDDTAQPAASSSQLYSPASSATASPARKKPKSSQVVRSKHSSVNQADRLAVMFNEPYTFGSAMHSKLTTAVSLYILEEGMAERHVERQGFQKLLKVFDKRYRLPSRSHFSKKITPRMYNEVYGCVKAELKDMDHFAATTDMWTSLTSDPYMSFTVHWIDKDWLIKARSLQVLHVPKSHTGQTIKDELEAALEEWDLDASKLSAITTDNASNNVNACELLGWFRMQCFGHRLNLAVRKSVKDSDLKEAIPRMKKVVRHFKSHKQREALKKAQNTLELSQHTLINECETRWGSLHKAIARFLEQEPAIRRVLTDDYKSTYLLLTVEELAILKSVEAAMSPLATFTDLLSGENTVTVSEVLPTLAIIKKRMTKPTNSDEADSELTTQMKEIIQTYMDSKYKDVSCQAFLEKASFLDPRYKTRFSPRAVDMIKAEAAPDNGDEGQKESVSASSQPRSSGAIYNMLDELDDDETVTEEESKINKELSLYTSLARVPGSTDPLFWWKNNSDTFPNLALLAKKYLCVPATSVPSERDFSGAGNIVTARRSCLNPSKVNQLCFLSANLRKIDRWSSLGV